MKLTVSREHIEPVLAAAAAMAGKDNDAPALKHVLIEAKNDKCTLTATDLLAGLRAPVPEVSVDAEGAVLAPVKLLHDIIKTLTGPVALAAEEGRLQITSGAMDMNIAALDPAEFPAWPQAGDDVIQTRIEAGILAELVERTAWAAAKTQDSRPTFTGLLMEVEKGRLNLVGCQGHVLAQASVEIESKNFRRVVPIPTMRGFAKMADSESPAQLWIGKNHILMRQGEMEFVGRFLDGSYPKWQTVIPQDKSVRVGLSRAEFQLALSRAHILTTTLKLSGDGEAITLSAQTPLGEIHDVVPARIQGGRFEVNFNINYLMNALRHLPSDDAQITFGSNPFVSATVSTEKDEYLAVVAGMAAKNSEHNAE